MARLAQSLSRDVRTIVIAAVVGGLASGTPTVAATVVSYAKNADKVDGKHAVAASTSPDDRAGKLVATNGKGRLPNNIIAQAPDSAKLGGLDFEDVVSAARAGVRTVVVSPVGTDLENGTALRTAIEAIDTSSGDYLVHAEPGVYDVGSSPLMLPDGIDLEGSGRAATTVKRTGDDSLDKAAVIETSAPYHEVRHLFVSNEAASGQYAVGIDSDGSMRLLDTDVLVEGGEEVVGVRGLAEGAQIRVEGSRITTQGAATVDTGISLGWHGLNMEGSVVDTGCSPNSTGIDFGPNSGVGILRNSIVGFCSGAGSRGIRNAAVASTVRVLNSWLYTNGGKMIESVAPGITLVGGTLVEGTVSGSVTCVASWDANFAPLDSACS